MQEAHDLMKHLFVFYNKDSLCTEGLMKGVWVCWVHVGRTVLPKFVGVCILDRKADTNTGEMYKRM